jgi:hypothetical protein
MDAIPTPIARDFEVTIRIRVASRRMAMRNDTLFQGREGENFGCKLIENLSGDPPAFRLWEDRKCCTSIYHYSIQTENGSYLLPGAKVAAPYL